MWQRTTGYWQSGLLVGTLLVVAASARTESSAPARNSAPANASAKNSASANAQNGADAIAEESVPDFPPLAPPDAAPEVPVAVPVPAPRPAAHAAGVRAFVDPVTGELTANPSPEQLQRMALAPRAAMSRSMTGLRPFELRSGGRGVNLQGRFASAMRVRVAPDGTFRMSCGDPAHDGTPHSHDDATGAVATGPVAASGPAFDRRAEQ